MMIDDFYYNEYQDHEMEALVNFILRK